jgi:hypothetical protein
MANKIDIEILRKSKATLASILLKVLNDPRMYSGKSSEIIEQWKQCMASDNELNNGYHQLIHFLDDEDIREREPEYARVQSAGLARVARLLMDSSSIDQKPLGVLGKE